MNGATFSQGTRKQSGGENWASCDGNSCTIAADHERTQGFISLVSATPKAMLWGQANQWCTFYFSPIAWACPAYAAEVVALGMVTANQMSQNDMGNGVRITFLTNDIRKFGIIPQ
jgi:hypothetical protein